MAINWGLFFTRDDLVIRLPMNPDTFPVTKEGDNTDYNVLGLGAITVPRIPKQKTVSISSFFPGRNAFYVLNRRKFEPPEFYINFFESAMNDRVPILYTPVRYYENGEPYFTNDSGFKVLVSSFSYEERAGETGDFYYSLELIEYRDYSHKIMTLEEKNTKSTDEKEKATTEKTREIPAGQFYVGCTVTANGNFYVSSYGDEPHGTASGRKCKVSRIITTDPKRAYPVHITTESGGALGWVKKENLQIVK